jgi:hypothetical protein
VTYYTTLAAALATCEALDHLDEVGVNRLQDLHREVLVQAPSAAEIAARETPARDSAVPRRDVGT